MPLQATSGAASYDGFGGGVAAVPNYIEDVFSTYLYTGTSATQTITNGIDLSTYGGMLWVKNRSFAAANNIVDTVRGVRENLSSNSTAASVNDGLISSFTTSGFTLPNPLSDRRTNYTGDTYASWTFRKQPKFFDVVTYSGNSIDGRQVSHSLGSSPGCVIIKRTDSTSSWTVWHRSLPVSATDPPLLKGIFLNTTAAAVGNNEISAVSATTVTLTGSVNNTGQSYVMYLFAHDAGGFGLTGTDNVISCGSFTHNSTSGVDVNLGYEPQWILQKNAGAASGWLLIDNMRGWFVDTNDQYLTANSSGVEDNMVNSSPTATGFKVDAGAWANGANIIYIAIRRGPMKVPTSGTSVFKPLSESGTGADRTVDAGFPVDSFFIKDRTGLSGPTAGGNVFYDRLRGNSNVLQTQSTAAEAVNATYTAVFNSTQNGVVVGSEWSFYAYREWCLRRAPSFFDEVCYTGTGSATTFSHNLGAVPELMIVKNRSGARGWVVYNAFSGATKYLYLNTTAAVTTYSPTWNNTAPTSSVFTVGTDAETNFSGGTFVAYLFATCAGVSKVGSYTGTGTTKQVDCGFTGGARFVLIKRTDSTGDWYVWDTARGIVAGNDPYLLLNSTAAEVTSTDYIDTYSAGFEISSTAPAAINASGGTFIFLAIA